jgi:hypothetical protein
MFNRGRWEMASVVLVLNRRTSFAGMASRVWQSLHVRRAGMMM